MVMRTRWKVSVVEPVALVMAPYLGVAPDVILYVSLAAAGMPFLFLIGAAPNAIAYESHQFTTREFLRAGIPASLVRGVGTRANARAEESARGRGVDRYDELEPSLIEVQVAMRGVYRLGRG